MTPLTINPKTDLSKVKSIRHDLLWQSYITFKNKIDRKIDY
jgi:hypothetical protein